MGWCGGCCCIVPHWRRRLDQSHLEGTIFLLHTPPTPSLPPPNYPTTTTTPPTLLSLKLRLPLITGGLLTANGN